MDDDRTLILHYKGNPFQYPGLGYWGLEVLVMDEGEVFTTELIFDDEDSAYNVVKHFKANIEPIIWEPPDEEN